MRDLHTDILGSLLLGVLVSGVLFVLGLVALAIHFYLGV